MSQQFGRLADYKKAETQTVTAMRLVPTLEGVKDTRKLRFWNAPASVVYVNTDGTVAVT